MRQIEKKLRFEQLNGLDYGNIIWIREIPQGSRHNEVARKR